MVIDRATVLELPQIEALARAYFTRLDRTMQWRPDATWWVARIGERVLGCYSYEDAADFGQRWILDLYRADGSLGAMALVRLYRHAYQLAGDAGLDVLFTIDPKNSAWARCVERYGDASPVGLIYLHKTRRS